MGQSTRRFNADAARLREAVDFIRAHACEGVGVKEVLEFLNFTRRKAVYAFREFTGHTILDEIQDVRYHHACQLLKDPKRPLDEVYLECGYGDNTAYR